jgi:hypothetical protein
MNLDCNDVDRELMRPLPSISGLRPSVTTASTLAPTIYHLAKIITMKNVTLSGVAALLLSVVTAQTPLTLDSIEAAVTTQKCA